MSFQAFVNMYFGEEISVEDLGDNLDFLREEYTKFLKWYAGELSKDPYCEDCGAKMRMDGGNE